MKQAYYNRGAMLLEIILYVTIIIVIILITSAFGINSIKTNQRLGALAEIEHNALFIIHHMKQRIRGATRINLPTLGTTNSSLNIGSSDTNKDPTTFNVIDGALQMTEGASSTILTTPSVTITSLAFHNISYPNTPGTLRIIFTIAASPLQKTFYLTLNLYKNPSDANPSPPPNGGATP